MNLNLQLSLYLCLFHVISIRSALIQNEGNFTHQSGNQSIPGLETTTTAFSNPQILRKTADVFGRRFIAIIEKYQLEANRKIRPDHALRMAYVNFAQDLSETIDHLVDNLRFVGLQLAASVDLSQNCQDNLGDLINGLQRQQSWSFKLLDSMGRLPTGFLEGATSDLGDYDECTRLEVSKDLNRKEEDENDFGEEEATIPPLNGPAFTGQYCLLTLKPKLPKKPSKLGYNQNLFDFFNTSLQGTVFEEYLKTSPNFYSMMYYNFGTCFPSTCSSDEINRLVNKVMKSLQIPVESVGTDCWIDETQKDMTTLQGLSIGILGFFIGLTVLASLIDMMDTSACDAFHNSLPRSILLCFSIHRNTKRFFRKRPILVRSSSLTKQHNLRSIHGARLLTTIWILITSNFIFGSVHQSLWMYRNNQYIIGLMGEWFVQPILNGWIAIDIFYAISGILFACSLLPKLEESKGKIDVLGIYIHRWLKFLPGTIGGLAVFQVFLMFDNGPMKTDIQAIREACSSSWWSNILFVNNWMSTNSMCGFSFWPLSVHVQLLILAPILVFIIHRNTRLGLRVILSIIFLSCLSSGILAALYDLKPALTSDYFLDTERLKKFAYIMIFPTYQHLPAYLVGILAGYYQQRVYNETSNYHKITLLTILVTSGVISIVMMIVPVTWTDQSLSTTSIALYAFFLRPMVATMACVFLVMCSTGNLKLFSYILSSEKLIPLSRLTFTVSLVHVLPIYLRRINTRQIKYWDPMQFISDTLVNFVFSLVLAYFLHVAFELPMMAVEMVVRDDCDSKTDTKVQNIRRAASTAMPDVEC